MKIWENLCSAPQTTPYLYEIRNGYYNALTKRNPFDTVINAVETVNNNIDSVNKILSYNPYGVLPDNWKSELNSLGFQVNSGVENASKLLSTVQNALQLGGIDASQFALKTDVPSAFDDDGHLVSPAGWQLWITDEDPGTVVVQPGEEVDTPVSG